MGAGWSEARVDKVSPRRGLCVDQDDPRPRRRSNTCGTSRKPRDRVLVTMPKLADDAYMPKVRASAPPSISGIAKKARTGTSERDRNPPLGAQMFWDPVTTPDTSPRMWATTRR